ncbi:sensor histidine kinase [Kribbella sp. NPDC058245]|uniref:sensor histidine kinase n=1 Tax=Kribbella sp. NPDC058245 TaxID=3346399 RepID=UPI0036E68383
MRRRISRVASAAVAVSLVLLAVPFAIGIKFAYFTDERTELERAALATAVQVAPDFSAADPVELPPPATDGQTAVYDRSLRLRAGNGPSTADELTRGALAGRVTQGQINGNLVVVVPIAASEQVVGVVRTASPVSEVWTRILLSWLAIVGVAALALLVGAVVAAWQARRLSAPLESLAEVSSAIAAGDLFPRAGLSGVTEIDLVARAQNAMLDRLTDVLDHERHFSSDAAHQLRTPLAGLRLVLETAQSADAREAIVDALQRTDELQRTVDEVLALSRLSSPSGPVTTVTEAFAAARHRWHGLLADAGRRIEFTIESSVGPRAVQQTACRQILDVLIDNARTHGRGTVSVKARDALGAIAIDVSDEGAVVVGARELFRRGTSGAAGPGIGLSLARNLAESVGGRLVLVSSRPTTFGWLTPDLGRSDSQRALSG